MIQRKSIRREFIGMGACCNYAIPFVLKRLQTKPGVGFLQVIPGQAQPLGRSKGNIGIDLIFIPVFNYMHILQSETIACPEYGTCIMGLVNIFKNNCEIPGPVLNSGHEPGPSFFCDEARKVTEELLLLSGIHGFCMLNFRIHLLNIGFKDKKMLRIKGIKEKM